MGKHTHRSYELKKEIVVKKLDGHTYSALSKEYNVLPSTIANWKRKYLEGTLHLDRRGRKPHVIEDVEILKKSYALLMKIRKTQLK